MDPSSLQSLDNQPVSKSCELHIQSLPRICPLLLSSPSSPAPIHSSSLVPAPLCPHHAPQSVPPRQPQGPCEHLSQRTSVSCSEPICGSILFRVKGRVLLVAHEASQHLPSSPLILSSHSLSLAHSALAAVASSQILALSAQAPMPVLDFPRKAVQHVIKRRLLKPRWAGFKSWLSPLSCVVMSK